MDAEKQPEPTSSRSEKAAAPTPEKTVTAVYRGPSGALLVDDYELRVNEPQEIPEEAFNRIRTRLPEHLLEQAEG